MFMGHHCKVVTVNLFLYKGSVLCEGNVPHEICHFSEVTQRWKLDSNPCDVSLSQKKRNLALSVCQLLSSNLTLLLFFHEKENSRINGVARLTALGKLRVSQRGCVCRLSLKWCHVRVPDFNKSFCLQTSTWQESLNLTGRRWAPRGHFHPSTGQCERRVLVYFFTHIHVLLCWPTFSYCSL